MMAPVSVNIEKIATGVPPRPPEASPTEAAGAVPRHAPPRPYTAMIATKGQTEVVNGSVIKQVPHTMAPPIIAGRRPTVSTKRPTGCREMVWTTAELAKAIPVQAVPRPSASVTKTGVRELRMPRVFHP